MRAHIADKVARLPDEPGVYVFVDAVGKALYVGKAASLRSRVRSYLKPGGDGRPLLAFVEDRAHDVEFVVTRTEQEALLLENTVIKKRKPTYNIRLKDDKSFLLLRLDRREPWPWFRFVRRRRSDGAEYFGPYASAKAVRRTLRLLHKIVPLRDCTDSVFHNRSRPCLKHQIGRCPAPCVGLIDHPTYARQLDRACAILRGEVGPVLGELRTKMDAAVAELEFERAQALKQQIDALCSASERQGVVGSRGEDRDVVGIHRAGAELCVVVLSFRDGRLENSRRFGLDTDLPVDVALAQLLTRFYEGDTYVPREVVVPGPIEDDAVLADWLSGKRGARVEIVVPQRGERRRQQELATANARLVDAVEADADTRLAAAAATLAELIGLDVVPQRVHCLDVSTMQGKDTVASRVCFVAGRPDKTCYRRFKISSAAAGDDFAAMQEAVRRSLVRGMRDEDDELPDLLIIDGGEGQLAAARRAMAELGLDQELAVVGLAKSRLQGFQRARRLASAERLVLPGRPDAVPLPEAAPVTLLVARIRDEAHRFAITYHRKLRGQLTSDLDRIPGIGPARRRALLRHFGSLSRVRAADLDALRAVPGLGEAVAERVFAALRGEAHG
ncbi:MAG: excinuclease ABC subunit UvrC [Planctomycetota bacterium]